ncbi:MAG TPA: serine/threonine-protein kinase, partial [Burkholderiaceae bacterium]|nr:serine/threonine-protein kinase [Burkholderiaceae bacterium]
AYIAMELLKGRDLRQLRQEGWRATPAQAALIVRRVADALGYAHSKGVVHRDVKPANIFMIGRTQPKVLDFGIARIAHQHDAPHSQGGDIAAGSPYYMAPEQVRHEPVDRRADVFSLGVVLYELLTDLKPFRGNTLAEITDAVLEHDPPFAHLVDPNVPEALAVICARALSKNPEHRFRSARAFSRELRHWLDENTVASEGGDVRVGAAAPRGRPLWLALAGFVTLALGTTAWLLLGAQRAAAPTAPITPPATLAATPVLAVAAAVVDAGASSVPSVNAMPASAAALPQAPPLVREAKDSSKERRAREAREREARLAVAAPQPRPAAPAATGIVRVAISPWGEVEVDGKPAGTSPPLTELSLSAGRHQIVVRNADLPSYSSAVNISADQPVTVKHKF